MLRDIVLQAPRPALCASRGESAAESSGELPLRVVSPSLGESSSFKSCKVALQSSL